MSITLTRDQAERCMREDPAFQVKWRGNVYTLSNGNVCRWDDASIAWVKASDWGAISPWLVAPVVMAHSDPNKTYDKLFGKTDMTNETEQKYLTRSEALKAMEEGGKVRGKEKGGEYFEFWYDTLLLNMMPPAIRSNWEVFGRSDNFTIVPQPDSPEKFVREFHSTCPSGPLPQHWEDFIQKFFKRSDDLIEQMDKEGK